MGGERQCRRRNTSKMVPKRRKVGKGGQKRAKEQKIFFCLNYNYSLK